MSYVAMKFLVAALCTISCVFTTISSVTEYHNASDSLQNKILKGYDKKKRPVKDINTPVKLRLHIFIEHLEEVNEVEQTVSLHGWMEMRWKDEFLVWDSSEYGGLRKTYVRSWQIWQPKLLVDNSALGAEAFREYSRWGRAIIRLSSDGTGSHVYRWPRFSFKFTCDFDFSDYPNDAHVCPIIIRAGVVPMTEIEIVRKGGVWLSLKWAENAWNNVHSISGWTIGKPYQEVEYLYWKGHNSVLKERPTNYTIASFTETWHRTFITLKRHAPYFGLLIVLPAIVTSLMTASVFWVVNRTHGIYICIFSLVIQALCSRDMLMKLPPCVGSLPRVVIFYGANLILTFLAIFLLLLLMNMKNFQKDIPRPLTLVLQLENYIALIKIGKINSNDDEYARIDQEQEGAVENVESVNNEEQQPNTSSFQSFSRKAEDEKKKNDWERLTDILTIIFAGFYFLIYFLLIPSCFLYF